MKIFQNQSNQQFAQQAKEPGSARLSNDSTKRVPGQWRWVRQGGDPVVVVVTGTPCHGMDSSDIRLPPALSPLGQNHICLPCSEHQNQRGCRFGEWSTEVGGIRGCLPTCGQESRENHPAALEGVPAQVGLPHIGLFFTFPPSGWFCLSCPSHETPACDRGSERKHLIIPVCCQSFSTMLAVQRSRLPWRKRVCSMGTFSRFESRTVLQKFLLRVLSQKASV